MGLIGYPETLVTNLQYKQHTSWKSKDLTWKPDFNNAPQSECMVKYTKENIISLVSDLYLLAEVTPLVYLYVRFIQ